MSFTKKTFIPYETVIDSAFLNAFQDEVINHDTRITQLENATPSQPSQPTQPSNGQSSSCQVYIDVTQHGVKEGANANVSNNTSAFQSLINQYKDTHVLYFPAGIYLLGQVDFGDKANISIRGVSSSFGVLMNKNINTGAIRDTFTKIVCCAPADEPLFKHTSCITVLDNIGFYNYYESASVGTGTHKNYLINTSDETNSTKGKVFATDCAFHGFKAVCGKSALQSSMLASRCRFTHNNCAIYNSVDGRFVDCSFNKNVFAMKFNEGANSGFTTLSACRIEWITERGIYINGAHDVTITGCEFDRCGYDGLHVLNSTNCTFTNNMFRRNGAVDTLTDDDFDKNLHIVMKNCTGCILEGNNTVKKVIVDTGAGISRPVNATQITGNTNCIITNNIFNGCTNASATAANQISSNTGCVVSNNIPTIQ